MRIAPALVPRRSSRPVGCARKILAVLAGAMIAIVLASSVAFAYWTALGSGSGSGSTAAGLPASDIANVTATGATATTLLHPGASGDVAVTVTNQNSYAIGVTGIFLVSASGCTVPALSFNSPLSYQVGGVTVSLPQAIASGASMTFTLPGAVTMGAASSDCQGQTLPISVTIEWAG